MTSISYKPQEPVENLKNLIECFVSLENTFSAIATPTGKRMFAITFLCEIEYIHHRLHKIAEAWKREYPLYLDRDELVSYISMFDEDCEQNIYDSVPSYFETYTDLLELEWIPNNHSDDENASYTESSHRDLRKMFKNRLLDERPVFKQSASEEEKVFEHMFEKFYEFRYGIEYAGFNDAGKDKIREYRKFLLMIDLEDLEEIIKMKYRMIKDDLEYILRIVDGPEDTACENLYMEAETIFEELCPNHDSKNDHWRRYNSRKKDYPERIKHQKDEIRKMIEEYGWETEWQDLFEYEEDDIQPDNLAIGSFIHYHLKELQAEEHKLLLVFMGLIDEWLFYTWEEMELLSQKRRTMTRSTYHQNMRQ